jgi:hypothetical protein
MPTIEAFLTSSLAKGGVNLANLGFMAVSSPD